MVHESGKLKKHRWIALLVLDPGWTDRDTMQKSPAFSLCANSTKCLRQTG